MSRIRLAQCEPPGRLSRRSREPAGSGGFRVSQDLSVRAYQLFDADHARAFGRIANVVRAVGRIAGSFMRRLMEAMYESRRKQAMTMLGCYDDLVAESQSRTPGSQNLARSGDAMRLETGTTVAPVVFGMRVCCAITGAPCEGDRAYLCDEWGCARKGGISPVSHENF
jgi:hypothetical protein